MSLFCPLGRPERLRECAEGREVSKGYLNGLFLTEKGVKNRGK
ncbi:hypothetical protein SAMN05421755_10214 [Nitrosomonas sp. Nm33]|nr:hypothetical protein SAMN05421755_10214 [Nitrosomonas sp. Nm33]